MLIKAASAAATGAVAGAIIALSGGRLYAMTLAAMQDSFPSSQIDIARLASLFGEDQMAMSTILGTAMGEGAVLTAAIVMANAIALRAADK